MLLIYFLSACSNAQSEKHSQQVNPYLQLSTQEQNVQQSNNESIVNQQEIGQVVGGSQLPFEDFKERWNAVAEEQMSPLIIKSLEKISNDTELLYRAPLSQQLELIILVSNGTVKQLAINSFGKSQNDIYSMLTGWTQMVNILHPNIHLHDVDALFNTIGVGPNGDLTNVKTKSFTYLDVNYDILPTEKGYTFKASYDKTQ